jgi:hypothetical protein
MTFLFLSKLSRLFAIKLLRRRKALNTDRQHIWHLVMIFLSVITAEERRTLTELYAEW